MLFDLKITNKTFMVSLLLSFYLWTLCCGLILGSVMPKPVRDAIIPKFVRVAANKYPNYALLIVFTIPAIFYAAILVFEHYIMKLDNEDPNKEYELKF
jgi:hypothetical protein